MKEFAIVLLLCNVVLEVCLCVRSNKTGIQSDLIVEKEYIIKCYIMEDRC